MERLNTNVRAFDSSLQETPKVFQLIGVNRAINICFSVVDDFVSVFIESFIRLQSIGVQLRAGRDVLTNLAMKMMLAAAAACLGGRSGQQTPIVVITTDQPDRYVVIDGYKRIAALQQLGRDTAEAVVWPKAGFTSIALQLRPYVENSVDISLHFPTGKTTPRMKQNADFVSCEKSP